MTHDDKRCTAASVVADAAENFLLFKDTGIQDVLIEELAKALRAWRDSYEEDVGRKALNRT